jgi:hypothetical protein
MRWNDNPQLVLELYALRITQPFIDAGDLLKRLEALEKGAPRQMPPAPVSTPLSPKATSFAPTPVARAIDPKSSSMASKSSPLNSSSPAVSGGESRPHPPVTAGNDATVSKEDAAGLWKRFLSELWKKPAVASHMERSYLKSATEKEWLVSFPDKFAMDSVQRSLSFILETLATICGVPMQMRFVHEARETRETSPMIIAAPEVEEKMAAASQDANVQKVLQMFKGKIRVPESE